MACLAPLEAGEPSSAHVPAEATRTSGRPRAINPAFSKASAIGDLQIFPVHTTRISTALILSHDVCHSVDSFLFHV